ncbi:MAG: ATP-binding cassette domain-containing protein, partial [Geminicoccaceae bacterium]
ADSGRVTRAPGLRFASMPQRLAIDPTLPIDVDRFLDLPHRHPAAERQAALARVGIAGLGRRPLQALSGGELQRVLLARALLRRPDLLVLDEPAAGIDYQGQAAFFGLIDSVRREQGCGILVVSHDLHLVMAATDRVVCLNRHVCCSGTPEAVGDDPGYLALFGPRTAAALARYHHHHDHEHALSGEVAHPTDCGRR